MLENNDDGLQSLTQCNDAIIPTVKKRRMDIDLLRIFACFFVLFNHTRGYQAFAHTDSQIMMWFCSSLSVITKTAVPLFYMISGAMLFSDKQESYQVIIKKRVLRVAVVIPFLTAMLAAIGAFRGYISTFSFDVCFRMTLRGADEVGGMPYWYLYWYIGMLLMLPFYRRMAKNMTKQDFYMLFFLYFFFNTFMQLLDMILTANDILPFAIHSDFKLGLNFALTTTVFFPLAGYYLDHNVDLLKISKKKLYSLFASGIAGIAVTCWLKARELEENGMEFTENYISLFGCVITISIFLFIKYICAKFNQFENHEKFVKAVTLAGSLAYGMYIFDPFMKWVVYSRFVALISPDTYMIYPNIIYCLLSMSVCGSFTMLLRRIPVIKKLV